MPEIEPETLMEMLFTLRAQLRMRTKNTELLDKIIKEAKRLSDWAEAMSR